MAGFNTLVNDFDVATFDMHLMNPAGQPAYAVQLGDSLDIAVGSWDITYNDKGKETSRTAIPPEIEGAVVKPCIMVLRSPTSPDAKEYLKRRKNTLTYDDVTGKTEDKNGNIVVQDEEKVREWFAAYVADFKDLPYEEKGVTSLAKYSEKNVLDLIAVFPGVIGQMLYILFDARNFGKPLATG